MGNKQCRLCVSAAGSPPPSSRERKGSGYVPVERSQEVADQQQPNLQHIADRERVEELDETLTPSDHVKAQSIFIQKKFSEHEERRKSGISKTSPRTVSFHKRRSSCSTIYIDDSTVSQPNIKSSIKCVANAVYLHIHHPREKEKLLPEIFDEKLHPLTKEAVPSNYDVIKPEQRHIYRFIRTLFNQAQLTAECAIVTLIYVERLLIYAEILLCPANWKRILLCAILLSSKVWDDQAVWNVDYCQILTDVTVESMNEMERKFLELINFNINVPSSVYAKYYFDLRTIAEEQNLLLDTEPLDKERARKLEATSNSYEVRFKNGQNGTNKKTPLLRSLSQDHLLLGQQKEASIVIS